MTWIWIDRKTRYYTVGFLYLDPKTNKVNKAMFIYTTSSTIEKELVFPLMYSHVVTWCNGQGYICLHKLLFPLTSPLQDINVILESSMELFKEYCKEHEALLQ